MARHGGDGLFYPFPRANKEREDKVIGSEMGFPNHLTKTLIFSQSSRSALWKFHGPFCAHPFSEAGFNLLKIIDNFYNILRQLSINERPPFYRGSMSVKS
jgi:hypothetical protein